MNRAKTIVLILVMMMPGSIFPQSQNSTRTIPSEVFSRPQTRLPQLPIPPVPSRSPLIPGARYPAMYLPFRGSVSRVLPCNFAGLTGLIHATSADVSKEGTLKLGFHSSWFQLENVYDRQLGDGESGTYLELPIFVNYSVSNDLEFALVMPVMNIDIKSRILWEKDYSASGGGDTKLSFKYRVFDSPEFNMRGAFGLGFKFPSGSEQKGLGTGQTDFEVFTAFSRTFEVVVAHLNLGYIMTGDPNNIYHPDGLADIFYYNVGIEYPHNHNVTIMTEVHCHDWGAEGLKVDVIPALRYAPIDNFVIDVSVPVALTNDQRYGYDYRIVFGLTSFFD